MKTEIIGLHNQRSAPERRSAAAGHPSNQTNRANQINQTEQASHRKKGTDPAQIYSKIVERYAMLFENPVARLRFLNNTLAKQRERQEQLRNSLSRFQFLENTRFYDWVLEARFYSAIMEELQAVAPSLPAQSQRAIERLQVPFSARAYTFVHQTRHAFYALGVVLAGAMLFGLYLTASWSARGVNAYFASKYKTGKAPIIVNAGGSGTPNDFSPAKYGYQPEKVWLVERSSEYERYSNGCRILTKYETENHPRGYYTIPRGSETDGEAERHDIAGIVYHTSESDIVPFIPDNNDSIQRRSMGLLDWIRQKKSYNYLIDRYGEIYRVVRDDHAAHHSGNSIWADSKYSYIGLNESFLGICFESTVSAGTLQETLTEAQISAGRTLTNVLRSKYTIDDANCTTHGLVSVNPDKMLIAFHHDWVRNFPFEAMGLSDKYKVQPPNMSDYGFVYDEETLEKLGRILWPGAIAAEEEFNKRSEKLHINAEVLRRRWRDRYVTQLEKSRKLHAAFNGDNKSVIAKQTAGTVGAAETGGNN